MVESEYSAKQNVYRIRDYYGRIERENIINDRWYDTLGYGNRIASSRSGIHDRSD